MTLEERGGHFEDSGCLLSDQGTALKKEITVESILMVPTEPVDMWSKICILQSKRCELGKMLRAWVSNLMEITSLPPPKFSHQVN